MVLQQLGDCRPIVRGDLLVLVEAVSGLLAEFALFVGADALVDPRHRHAVADEARLVLRFLRRLVQILGEVVGQPDDFVVGLLADDTGGVDSIQFGHVWH